MAGSIYSAQADLNLDADRFIELTDTSSATGVINQAVMDLTSLDAQDDIDGMLQGTYVVPFLAGQVPAPIRRLHARLWRFKLFQHRDSLSIPADIRKDFEEVMADLVDYGNAEDGGKVLVGAPRVSMLQFAGGPGSFHADADATDAPVRIFGRLKDGLG